MLQEASAIVAPMCTSGHLPSIAQQLHGGDTWVRATLPPTAMQTLRARGSLFGASRTDLTIMSNYELIMNNINRNTPFDTLTL